MRGIGRIELEAPLLTTFMLLVILVGGGTKKRQDSDIATAKAAWVDYKRRKRTEGA